MTNQSLQYFMHDEPEAFRLELAGDLNDGVARRVEQVWRTAFSSIGRRAFIVDMTFVTNVDEQGRALLGRWYAAGAQLIAKSKLSRDLAEASIGQPLLDPAMPSGVIVNRRWAALCGLFGTPALLLMFLLAFALFPIHAQAATLKSETVAAWDDYLASVNATLQDRVRPGGAFLWTDEDSGRLAKVRSGEIVIAPAPGPNPRKAPGGLIHHWIGAAFLPDARLEEILEVTEDYDRYKEFYRPSVIESKAVVRSEADDRFSMLIMNKALFLKVAMDADYRATNVRLDQRRFYCVSRSTRIQEIEDYGQASEHRLPAGEGGGYIWKLSSVARMEQRDGGVYIEMEVAALSRDIPGPVRLVVEPIVRRVSRNSLFTSIKQTMDAVRSSLLTQRSGADVPSTAGQLNDTSAVSKNQNGAFARVH